MALLVSSPTLPSRRVETDSSSFSLFSFSFSFYSSSFCFKTFPQFTAKMLGFSHADRLGSSASKLLAPKRLQRVICGEFVNDSLDLDSFPSQTEPHPILRIAQRERTRLECFRKPTGSRIWSGSGNLIEVRVRWGCRGGCWKEGGRGLDICCLEAV